MEYHQIWVAAVTLLLIEGVGSIPSLYDRILFIYLVLLFKSISKDIPIAVSAADIANNCFFSYIYHITITKVL
jgi:hypothetical protein